MGAAKRDAVVAFVRGTSASHKPTTGLMYPLCGSANVTQDPQIAEIISGLTPDTIEQYFGGHTDAFELAEMVPTFDEFGYLWAVHLGKDTWGTGSSWHTIEPDSTSQYLNVQLDDKLDKGTSTPTRRLFGGKIETLEFEMRLKDYCRMRVSGPGCDVDYASALTQALGTGSRMSWAHIKDASAYFKVGYNGSAAAAETDITGFKITSKRTKAISGIDIGHAQPQAILDGLRSVEIEYMKIFASTTAKSAYLASVAGQQLELVLNLYAGTAIYATSASLYGKVIGAIPDGISADDEEIAATVRVRLNKNGTNPIIKWTVKDGVTSTGYW